MKLSRVIFIAAVIVIAVWLLGLLLKLAAWLISSLLYVAAAIVIVGIATYWWQSHSKTKPTRRRHHTDRKVVEAKIIDKSKK